MKGTLVWVISLVAILAAAQDTPEKPKVTQEELEARFKSTFNKAIMSGRWAPLKDGKLGDEKKDQYNINSATKVGKDLWLINARMEYGGKEMSIPVPVQVKWAGDTAVMIVEKFAVPGSNNAYSARVQIYENTYAGTWSGGDHGGMLYGTITQAKDSDQSKQ